MDNSTADDKVDFPWFMFVYNVVLIGQTRTQAHDWLKFCCLADAGAVLTFGWGLYGQVSFSIGFPCVALHFLVRLKFHMAVGNAQF